VRFLYAKGPFDRRRFATIDERLELELRFLRAPVAMVFRSTERSATSPRV
jgi:hypothetical protein